uniref:Zasp-like motif domain-containing protein n=1 Tax=Anopheles farauti TaxID=69004 RepID=A0A182QCS2_9DIPT
MGGIQGGKYLAAFLVGLALAEKKNVTEQSVEAPAGAKEKRQTEHETHTIPLSLIANRRQQHPHQHQQQQEYYQSDEAAGPFYAAAQPSTGQPVAGHKTGASQEQPQYQELPPEYISLLHQLAEHQPKAAALKQGKAVNQQYEPQSHAQHSKPNQVQYITEEEYAQLLKQAQQQPGPVASPHHPHHHQSQQQPQPQPQPQPQGLQAYGRPSSHGPPAGSHKYRPSIQLLETGEEPQGVYGHQADGEQYRIQYKSIQQAGTVTPVPKPVSSFSFENELAKLVESNRPLAYHQVPHHHHHHHPGRHEVPQHDAQRYGPTPSPQSHEYTYVQAAAPSRDHGAPPPPKQSIKAQYIAPFAQGLPLTGPKIRPEHLQVGPQKFVDSPAQKYQFIAQPEAAPSKAHHYQQQQQQQQQQQHHHHQAPAHQGQQYLTEVSPKQHPGTPSPKIQYYIPKEKNVQIYYQQQAQQQQQQHQQQQQQSVIEQHSPQHPMKIVEAPQLQNEKPQKTVHSVHRTKPAEQQHRYAPREKQQDATDAHAPSRSAIYVSQSTGVTQSTAAATPAPAAHGHKIPPKIDRPLTQEEFQALVDAGYSVVPVPVPVPVPISQFQQHQQQQAASQHAGHPGAAHPGPRGGHPHPTPAAIARQAAQASRYHLHQLATAENNPNQVVTYLRPLHLDPFSAGVRGPHKAAP